ncbi:helix-turn-helix domain-containing protein [Amycolatopsis sp. lyj-90]|uniref:helix-turn-helix domain-containing protein n=1 Tax=Amycolatopsis sp. lyj-90 TaxID=2789285 RepID=UPI00397E47CD
MKSHSTMFERDSDDDAEAMAEVTKAQHQLGKIRKARGWTCAYVAKQLDVHPASVWKWENHPACARVLDHLQMYARFLGYTLRVVLVESDEDDAPMVES